MSVATVTAELFVAIVFAVINLQIQIRFMAWWWARGCTWRQFLDVYDLGDKHKKWMTIDIITNSAIMFLAAAIGWTLSPTIALGIFGVEVISLVCLPLRFAGAKRAVRHNPNLLRPNEMDLRCFSLTRRQVKYSFRMNYTKNVIYCQ